MENIFWIFPCFNTRSLKRLSTVSCIIPCCCPAIWQNEWNSHVTNISKYSYSQSKCSGNVLFGKNQDVPDPNPSTKKPSIRQWGRELAAVALAVTQAPIANRMFIFRLAFVSLKWHRPHTVLNGMRTHDGSGRGVWLVCWIFGPLALFEP